MLDMSKFEKVARYEGGVNRRLFLAYAAGLSTLPLVGRRAEAAQRSIKFASDPFKLGVASGDPTERGLVLWTRLVPEPLQPGGGMAPEEVEVTWEVARDDAMRDLVQRGTSVATPKLAHSVHAEVDGLEPGEWYWYRFRAGDAESPIGRARTMPTPASSPKELRFAIASCQHYEYGYYTAYEHMAKENLDLVFHLGDYIYEYGAVDNRVRKHVGKELQSLDDYRVRHAQYKTDPMLQAMHAQCPWIVTWDDHELANDCAGEFCGDIDPIKFLVRRAAAYQAYYEMMPLRHTSLPTGPHMQLYRPVSFGNLAQFFVLDTRQYRTKQPYNGGRHDIDDAAMSPEGTIMGKKQMEWLKSSLAETPAQWNALTQQVQMAMVDMEPGEVHKYSMEKWSGYAYDRQQVMRFLDERRVKNPIVLTGDIHSNWVSDLRVDDRHMDTPVVATEFCGTSISSSGDGVDKPKHLKRLMTENPFVHFHNCQRGYVACTVTPNEWRSDFRVLDRVSDPNAAVHTRATYVVEAGKAGATLA